MRLPRAVSRDWVFPTQILSFPALRITALRLHVPLICPCGISPNTSLPWFSLDLCPKYGSTPWALGIALCAHIPRAVSAHALEPLLILGWFPTPPREQDSGDLTLPWMWLHLTRRKKPVHTPAMYREMLDTFGNCRVAQRNDSLFP